MKVHPAVLLLLVLVPLVVAAMSLGLWVVTGDARALARTADALLNPPEIIVPDATVLVHQVNQLARLETASLVVEQRIRGQRGTDGTWSLLGERMEFVARGEVVAGVDLARLEPADLVVDEQGDVRIRLPPAEIWHVDFDEQGSFVALRERGWLGWPDPDFESRVRREAEQSLEKQARQRGILELADEQAATVVTELLTRGGAHRVTITR